MAKNKVSSKSTAKPAASLAKIYQSSAVEIFEVGPRDGLQNEKNVLSTDQKVEFILGLAKAGVKNIEMGAFVRPDKVPQMADTDCCIKRFKAVSWIWGRRKRGL